MPLSNYVELFHVFVYCGRHRQHCFPLSQSIRSASFTAAAARDDVIPLTAVGVYQLPTFKAQQHVLTLVSVFRCQTIVTDVMLLPNYFSLLLSNGVKVRHSNT